MNNIVKAAVVSFIFALGMLSFPLFYTLVTGDFPGAQIFYGLQEDHDFVSFVFSIRELFV